MLTEMVMYGVAKQIKTGETVSTNEIYDVCLEAYNVEMPFLDRLQVLFSINRNFELLTVSVSELMAIAFPHYQAGDALLQLVLINIYGDTRANKLSLLARAIGGEIDFDKVAELEAQVKKIHDDMFKQAIKELPEELKVLLVE